MPYGDEDFIAWMAVLIEQQNEEANEEETDEEESEDDGDEE
jgi:hypothetical protein